MDAKILSSYQHYEENKDAEKLRRKQHYEQHHESYDNLFVVTKNKKSMYKC